MSAILRAAQIVCMAILVSVTAGFWEARAESSLQAASASQHLQLAQRDVAYCRNWAAQIQSARNAYNSQCSAAASEAITDNRMQASFHGGAKAALSIGAHF